MKMKEGTQQGHYIFLEVFKGTCGVHVPHTPGTVCMYSLLQALVHKICTYMGHVQDNVYFLCSL